MTPPRCIDISQKLSGFWDISGTAGRIYTDFLLFYKQGVHPTLFGMMYALFWFKWNYSASVLTVTISDFVIVVHFPST